MQLGTPDQLHEVTIGKGQPNGIGGWLAVLVFALLVAGPAVLLARIAEYPTPVVIFISIVLGVWSIYCGIWLVRRKPNAPRITKIFFIAIFCFYALAIVADILLGVTKPGSIDVESATSQVLGGLLGTIGWYAYLQKSRRVKNTYSLPSSTA